MKINDTKNNAVNLGLDKATVEKASADKASAVAGKSAGNASESQSSDSVTLSPMAQKLKSLQTKIGTDSVFDAEKVNQIKSAIMDGQFKINTDKVADGLIQSVKDMLGNKS